MVLVVVAVTELLEVTESVLLVVPDVVLVLVAVKLLLIVVVVAVLVRTPMQIKCVCTPSPVTGASAADPVDVEK